MVLTGNGGDDTGWGVKVGGGRRGLAGKMEDETMDQTVELVTGGREKEREREGERERGKKEREREEERAGEERVY